MYATFVIPLLILRHTLAHPEGITGRVLCTLLTGGNLAWVGATSSVFTMTAIAIKRYYAVIHPHRNSTKLITRKLKIDGNSAMNQSELKGTRCKRCQARENANKSRLVFILLLIC